MRLSILLIALLGCMIASAQNPVQNTVPRNGEPGKTSSAADSVQSRIILVGDAGSLVKGKASVIDVIRNQMNLDKKTTIIFLGDNLYDVGLPDEYARGYNQAKAALDSQIHIAHGKDARVFIIPGNHDWNNSGPNGEDAIIRQQEYVDRAGEKNVKFYPEGGCPGPVEVKISEDVVMIIMDSQWWLHPYEKPGIESDCDNKIPEQVLAELQDMLQKNLNKLVIFACHHPFKSNGVHGGYYTWKQHLFPFTELRANLYIPLPVLGSIYPIARSVFGTPQDIPHPGYQNMINSINNVLKDHPHVIRVHGHEHTLQWIQNDSLAELITGSGCKTQRVSDGPDTRFTARELGFAVLEMSNAKRAKATFYELNGARDSAKEAYSGEVMEYSKLPKLEKEDTTQALFIYKDRATAPASLQYQPTHGIKKLMNGTNYRSTWSQPVSFKVFNINKEKGGFKIDGVGGGKQTKSLKLIDKNGDEWTLRTIDKDPELALPQSLRGSFAQSIVQDLISASNPYAPLAIPVMADAAGIIAPHPEFFYVPDDPALGYYRPFFASKICMLERKELSTGKEDDSKSSLKLFNKMREDNDQTVDQASVLRARLLDMLIGDWDRHFDQWRWIPTDTGKGKYFIPVPRDRDQAFSNSNGLLVKAVARRFDVLRGFKTEIKSINEWNSTAKDFDRYFLNQLDQHAWDSVTTSFIDRVDTAVMAKAVRELPVEIYPINGREITDKLIDRRTQMQKESMKYYRFLSEIVTVLGSNKNEYFHLSSDEGRPKLEVFAYKDNTDTSFLMYHRIFDPKITKELRLYGFGGDDKFTIDEEMKSKILVRIIGGRGEDSFLVQGPMKTFIYDNTHEKNGLVAGRRTHNKLSGASDINNYELNNYKYTVVSYPRIGLGYNGVDGIFVGTGFSVRTHGFRKDPFLAQHRFAALFALGRRAHTLKYTGEFTKVIGKNDIVVDAKYSHPGLNFFFGFGNNTRIADGLDGNDYRVRYNVLDADVLLRRKLARTFSISVGPNVFHYWNKYNDNKDFILADPTMVGLDSANIFTAKTYVGGKLIFDLNNINNQLFPTRGISWRTQFTSIHAVRSGVRSVNKLESELAVYASLRQNPRVVTVLKAGAGHIFENEYEFFQAMTFGGDRDLRGFRRNRYAGSTMAYGSLEFRLRLFEAKGTVLPGQFGLISFGDIGRVWYAPEESKRWHPAFGGGVYFVPFNLVIVTAGLAKSPDELLFNISIGSKLNLTF